MTDAGFRRAAWASVVRSDGAHLTITIARFILPLLLRLTSVFDGIYCVYISFPSRMWAGAAGPWTKGDEIH